MQIGVSGAGRAKEGERDALGDNGNEQERTEIEQQSMKQPGIYCRVIRLDPSFCL